MDYNHSLVLKYADLRRRSPTPEQEIAELEKLAEEARRENLEVIRLTLEGGILLLQEKYEQAILVLDRALVLDSDNAFAQLSKGYSYGRLGFYDQSIAIFEDIISRYCESENPALKIQVAAAISNKGNILVNLGRLEEAIASYEDVIERYGRSGDRFLRERVAMCLVNKGFRLEEMGRMEEALDVYEEVFQRFGESDDKEICERVARSLVNKAVRLGEMGRREEALAACEEVLKRFGGSENNNLRMRVAKSLLYRGLMLEQLGSEEEALSSYSEVIDRFGNDENTPIRDYVSKALMHKNKIFIRKDNTTESEKTLNLMKSIARDGVPGSLPKQDFHVAAIEHVMQEFSKEKESLLAKMLKRRERAKNFLAAHSDLDPEASFLLTLREWNSYTPAIPDEYEEDRGGGYFIWHEGTGVVIDPGYDFIENFHMAGCRIHDIHAVVITHAHNDHTADLETLFSLLHTYNKNRLEERKPHMTKKVKLIVSVGTERKFSGLYSLRETDYISETAVMNRGDGRMPQRIRINDTIYLTALRAYHDDVVSRDNAVGLCFEIDCGDGEPRRILFAGDTGLYPKMIGPDGNVERFDNGVEKVEAAPGLAVHEQYPDEYKAGGEKPVLDILVPHIGSIQPFEFESEEARQRPEKFCAALGSELKKSIMKGRIGILSSIKDPAPWENQPIYYPNHLGLRGTVEIIANLMPRAAIISEFGEEFKDIKISLVRKISAALQVITDDWNKRPIFIVPGDITIVYDIRSRRFLCHSSDPCEFVDPIEKGEIKLKIQRIDDKKNIERPYLFKEEHIKIFNHSEVVKNYDNQLKYRKLPYFKKSSE